MKTSKNFLSSLKLLCNSDTKYTYIESKCTHIILKCTLTANLKKILERSLYDNEFD